MAHPYSLLERSTVKRFSRRRVYVGVIAVLTAAALVAIVLHPGMVTHDVDLHDGGVWVTNGKMKMVAHLNYPSQTLDGGLRTSSTSFDVDQSGSQVFMSDASSDTYTQIDVARTTLMPPNTSAGSSTMELGGDRIGVADPATGKVWVASASQAPTFSQSATPPTISDMPGAVLAMGTDGSAHVASIRTGTVKTVTPRGSITDISTTSLPKLADDAELQVSAVGDKSVVLDRRSGTLVLPGGQTSSLPGDDLQLQVPGPQADEVLVSSTSGLLRVSLSGKVSSVSPGVTGGSPSRPAQHSGCAYAAWGVKGSFLRDCAGTDHDVDIPVPTLNNVSKAVFRTNRDVIVLNDIPTGGVWLPDKNMVQVDNWEQINSQTKSEEYSDEESTETRDEATAERSKENTPPQAQDDSFGVRPGRTSYLPVIANDTDPDGDVLVATATSQPSFGQVGQVRSGAALQVKVDDSATGSSSFAYTLDDGQAQAGANVTLNVHPFSVNAGPEQKRLSSLDLASGASTTLNVSDDWLDPDGDPVFLKSISFPPGFDVTYRADGTITVKDMGQTPGSTDLTVTYSDGTEDTEGRLTVKVHGNENLPPVTNADHVVVPVGQSGQVSPLANDVDANGDTLRLASVGEAPEGLSATADVSTGVVTLNPSKAGTFYLTYTVSDGPTSTEGVIRVDAIEVDQSALPVAQDDVITLPAGGQALSAVLDNDSDPQGGVLSVQSVRTPEGSPLVVALLEHHLLRITAPNGLTETTTVTYTLANAAGTTEGTLQVIPVPAAPSTTPPELTDDTLVVRAGDVGAVSVLDNDRSPAGLDMSVQPDLQHEIDPAMGEPFVSNDVVRFRAREQPGSGRIIYSVRDSEGNVASASVNLTVVARDDERNTAPHPKDVTGWAVAGEKVTIPIPMEGLDSEGDSVSLSGLMSSPRLGGVELEGSSLIYTAAPKVSGTDVFSYTVQDRLGKTASAVVRVGVAPAGATNQRPVAVADVVTARPGVDLSVPVLANDVDPDGDTLSLESSLVSGQDSGVSPSADGPRVKLTTPSAEGSYTVQYGVTDGRSEPVVGMVTLVVSGSAPLQAPIARDDRISKAQARSNRSVKVPVLDNDEDPDGDISAATVTSQDEGVSVGQDGELTITVGEEPRFVLYTVTDPSGLTSSALVEVPGSVVTEPEVDAGKMPLTVRSGQTLTIALRDYVLTREGRSVQLTDGNKVTAAAGWNGSSLVKDSTTLTFTSRPDYTGPSSVTVEVTDGKDLNDSSGKTAWLTLPITVTPGDNRPPVIAPTAIEVAPGETATVDVSLWATDPDGEKPADLSYSVREIPAGIEASLSGRTLSVTAPSGASKGSLGSLSIDVKDGSGAQGSGSVPVSIVSSSRPLIMLSPASVSADAGQSTTVNISSYAVNPFPDSPIRLVGTPTAPEGITVTGSGSTLTITPAAGARTGVITYRVGDKTGDAGREVEGTLQVTVRNRPSRPTSVAASSSSASTALVSWTAGAANGAPISGFTVYDETQGDSQDCGTVTSCLMEGRTNGKDHTFHVVAHNEVGDSEASASATTSIDVVPDTVPQPVATAGDGSVSVSWSAPSNQGSAITGYVVALSPGGQQQTVSGTSATFSGLSNGTAYTAVVKAVNAKGESQQWSSASLAVSPYGRPGPVGSVQAASANLGTGGSSDTVTVSWGPVSDTNGRSIEYYTVTSSTGASKTVSGADNRSATLEGVSASQSQVTFTVTATNDSAKASTHTSAGQSTSTWVVGRPPAPTVRGVSATGTSRQISLSAGASAGNGWSAGELATQWSTDGSSWQSVSDLSGNGLSDGSASTVYVRVCGSKTGSTSCSEAVSAGSVTPFGPPASPSISCSAGSATSISCSWSGGGDGGRSTRYRLSGPSSDDDAGASGSQQWSVAEGSTTRVCIRAVQSSSELGSREGQESCAEATTRSFARNYAGSLSGQGKCNVGECAGHNARYQEVTLSDWPPNSTVTCSGTWNQREVSTTLTVDGSGGYSGRPRWQGGYNTILMSNEDRGTWFTCS